MIFLIYLAYLIYCWIGFGFLLSLFLWSWGPKNKDIHILLFLMCGPLFWMVYGIIDIINYWRE